MRCTIFTPATARSRCSGAFRLRWGDGEIVGLLGRNGVGKTTTLKAIMGLVRASTGRATFDGVDLTGLAAHKVPAQGIGYVPQGRGIFPNLTR